MKTRIPFLTKHGTSYTMYLYHLKQKASRKAESSTEEEMSPASPKKKGVKRQVKAIASTSEDDFSPEPAKKTARRVASPKKRAKTPVSRVKSSPVKRVSSPKGTPKTKAIPFPPIGSRGPPINGSPLPKKSATPVAKKTKADTKSKGEAHVQYLQFALILMMEYLNIE